MLVPWMVAGVRAQFEEMRKAPGMQDARVIPVYPYRPGGHLERLPLPSTLKGTIRSTLGASPAVTARRVTTVWTQVALPMLPFALIRSGPNARLYYAIDCTPTLLHSFGGHYSGVDAPSSRLGRFNSACLRLFFRRCAGLLPWSAWAARSMVDDYGADENAVHVVPPGIDLAAWEPAKRDRAERPRLLFVGGDFERKGGPLLLDVYRHHLRGEADLHVVTRARLEREPGVYVHTDLVMGDERLRKLYQSCDLLVLPTLADCFSIAALEAMACGLPVIISRTGGVPEIVIDGETGILVPPGRGDSLLAAIRVMLASRSLRGRMGAAGRERAERRFDAGVQAATTLRIMSGEGA